MASEAKGKARKTPEAAAPTLPGWLPPAAWAAWLAFRKSKRQPYTPHAQALSLRNLEALRGQGHDPVAVLEQSIERGWTGLFPVKTDRAPAPPTSAPDPAEAARLRGIAEEQERARRRAETEQRQAPAEVARRCAAAALAALGEEPDAA